MALRAAALLAADPEPDAVTIAEALDPAICRCGCYPRIARAVRRAADLLRDPAQLGAEPQAAKPAPLARPRRPWDLCSPEEREWFDVLGDGLVVVWPPPAGVGGAWVHLSPSGTVTAGRCPRRGSGYAGSPPGPGKSCPTWPRSAARAPVRTLARPASDQVVPDMRYGAVLRPPAGTCRRPARARRR